MADYDEVSERWELPVVVPAVTEEIKVLRVRCGDTSVEVREDGPRGAWRAWEGDWPEAAPVRPDDYEGAVEDARQLARKEERRRLLAIAMDEALAADPGEDTEGVSRG